MVNFQNSVNNAVTSMRNLSLSLQATEFAEQRLQQQKKMADLAYAKKQKMDAVAVRLKYEKGKRAQDIKIGEMQKKSDARVEQYAKDLASGKKSKTTKEEKAKAEEVANNAKI